MSSFGDSSRYGARRFSSHIAPHSWNWKWEPLNRCPELFMARDWLHGKIRQGQFLDLVVVVHVQPSKPPKCGKGQPIGRFN